MEQRSHACNRSYKMIPVWRQISPALWAAEVERSVNMGRSGGKRKGCEGRGKLRGEMKRMLVLDKMGLHFYKIGKPRSTGN